MKTRQLPSTFWLLIGLIFATNAVVATVTGSALLFGVLCSITTVLAASTYLIHLGVHSRQ